MSRRVWQVLIVDDSAEDRAQIRRLLLKGSEDQLIFTEAVLGHEAIRAVRQSSAPPDCMILDYYLPDMEAPAVLEALRHTDGLAVCPVIVLTGAAGSTLGHDVLRAGAQDFIGKDWLTSGSLVRAVENASQRWMMAGELERGARALALREHELRTLTDNTPEVLSRFDAAFRYVYANAAIARTTGHAPEHFIGHTLQELGMPAAVYVPWQHALAGVFTTGNPDQLELSEDLAGVRSDRATRFVPEFGVDGEVVSVLTITHDITDRKHLEQALRREDRRKDEFLAILSHELRNPLAALSTGLQVLKAATGSGISVRPVQEMMDRQFRHMVRLVDDLLDVSRISNGRIELKRVCIPMQTVLEHAIEANESFMLVAGHKLVLAIDPEPAWVDGDLTRLAQVVGNLLHNAIKYTPHVGRIDLSMRIDGSDVVVSVADDGAGIPPDMVTHVFDLFTQVEHTLQRAQGGLGIGLGVVAELVALHGGSVMCQSPGLGMGSTFTIRLPRTSAPALPVMPSIPVVPLESAPVDRPSRVLVVDDNVDAADVMAMMLEMHDCHAMTAHTGMDALAASLAFLPDMILLDIGLPDIEGYEVARRLRADPRTGEVILVALTGWGSASDRLRSAAAGFDAHLTKPVEVATILSLLRSPGDVLQDRLPCLT